MWILNCFMFGQRAPTESRKSFNPGTCPSVMFRNSEVSDGTAMCIAGIIFIPCQYRDRRFGKSGSPIGGLQIAMRLSLESHPSGFA